MAVIFCNNYPRKFKANSSESYYRINTINEITNKLSQISLRFLSRLNNNAYKNKFGKIQTMLLNLMHWPSN